MKKANAALGLCFGFFLMCALSMGNRMYLLIAATIALAWGLAFASVRMAERSVKVENALSGFKVNRGEVVSMEISVSHQSLLPIAPVALRMRATSNTPAGTIHLTRLGKRRQRVVHRFAADHVGAMFPGVDSYVVSDVFGFFKHEHKPDTAGQELLVLPVPFEATWAWKPCAGPWRILSAPVISAPTSRATRSSASIGKCPPAGAKSSCAALRSPPCPMRWC